MKKGKTEVQTEHYYRTVIDLKILLHPFPQFKVDRNDTDIQSSIAKYVYT